MLPSAPSQRRYSHLTKNNSSSSNLRSDISHTSDNSSSSRSSSPEQKSTKGSHRRRLISSSSSPVRDDISRSPSPVPKSRAGSNVLPSKKRDTLNQSRSSIPKHCAYGNQDEILPSQRRDSHHKENNSSNSNRRRPDVSHTTSDNSSSSRRSSPVQKSTKGAHCRRLLSLSPCPVRDDISRSPTPVPKSRAGSNVSPSKKRRGALNQSRSSIPKHCAYGNQVDDDINIGEAVRRSPRLNLSSRSNSSISQVTKASNRTYAPERKDQSNDKHRHQNTAIENKSRYPLETAEFQRKVLRLLLEIKSAVTDSNRDASSSSVIFEKLQTVEDMQHFEKSLNDKEEFAKFKSLLSTIGASGVRPTIKKMLLM
ncbi:micronuclear linker histone polyprotein-like [Clytia hemisphaerica]|uniref:micronuclear linker histone polyprotein-like n=1 Tax=Clytia hemisphaerica TaxID=252671 RepID=UPI0034D65E9D